MVDACLASRTYLQGHFRPQEGPALLRAALAGQGGGAKVPCGPPACAWAAVKWPGKPRQVGVVRSAWVRPVGGCGQLGAKKQLSWGASPSSSMRLVSSVPPPHLIDARTVAW